MPEKQPSGNTITSMKIKKQKGLKGKCDALFSKIIRSAGVCNRCGSRDWLQTAHIISRRYSNTRCDIRNAWCLCAGCHRRLTDWPREHSRYITETIGSEAYEELRAKAESFEKVDWSIEYEKLKEIWKNME